MGAKTEDAATAAIAGRVILVRGLRVLIDADLATLDRGARAISGSLRCHSRAQLAARYDIQAHRIHGAN
jgi:hypothetical protein